MKKRIMAVVLLVLSMRLTACGPREETEPVTSFVEVETEVPTTEEAEDEGIRVCMIYNSGIAESAYDEACKMAAEQAADEFDADVIAVEGDTAKEWKAGILKACEEGYDLIIGTSPLHADYIAEYAPKYPEVKFVVMGAEVVLPNVQSMCFSLKDGYFLAGAAAAMLTERTDLDGMNDVAVIGWVADVDIPVVHEWLEYYEQGARYINPDIQVVREFSGEWTDPQKGRALVADQFLQGADVVMQVPFDLENGMLGDPGKNYLCASSSNAAGNEEVAGICLASVKEQVDVAVRLAIQVAAEDLFEGGYVRELSLKDGGVTFSMSQMSGSLGEHVAWQETYDVCRELEEKIRSGELLTEKLEE